MGGDEEYESMEKAQQGGPIITVTRLWLLRWVCSDPTPVTEASQPHQPELTMLALSDAA